MRLSAPCIDTVFCRRGHCGGRSIGDMPQSTDAQGCGLPLHYRAGVVVASLVVRRRAGAEALDLGRRWGCVDERAGGRRLVALRLSLLLA